MLLDTNAFVFLLRGDARALKPLRAAISDPNVPMSLSLASFWELTIKHRKGKLPLPAPFTSDPVRAVETWCDEAAIAMLPLSIRHVGRAMTLDFAHNDPFDRVIAATAMVEGMELVTSDKRFASCKGLRVVAI